MSIIKKGTDFGPTEQVTSTKLDNLVDNASFTDTSANAVAYTGSTGTCLQGGGLEVTSAGQLQVKDSGITTAKLNDNAVTTAKITDLNVTTAKIAADAITTAKIADNVELGGNPTTTTQSASNNSTRIATTKFVNDLLDTFTATAPTGSTVATCGTITLPGGLVLKFGSGVSTQDEAESFTFKSPAFPNNCFAVVPSLASQITARSTTGFTMNRLDEHNGSPVFDFIAIGN